MPEVTPLMGASQETYGAGTTLEVIDAHRFKMSITTAFPEALLYAMAYGNCCPGSSHILKPVHPKYGGKDCQSFHDAFPADLMNFPTMGAWAVVEHRPTTSS